MTLIAVGQRLGLTRERIRQIENVAVRKLCHQRRQRAFAERVEALMRKSNPKSANSLE